LREIRGAAFPESPLAQIARLLQSGRQYFAVTVFLLAGTRLVRTASAGPPPRCDSMRLGEGNVGHAAVTGKLKVVPDVARDAQYVQVFSETRSELIVPIKIGAHVIGVIDVESDRRDAFSFKDRVLLREAAAALARFLVGPGKYLVMKAREAALEIPPVAIKQPPARAAAEAEPKERLRAAAGEKAR
jgi:putative methionine-R-sulfoxide reductase with GAF domain